MVEFMDRLLGRQQPEIQPEIDNLAAGLDEKKAGEIAEDAIGAFEEDEDSRSDWMTKHSAWLDIYYQQQKPKDPPWEGASEESIPLLTEAVNQFSARALQAFFPSNDIIQAIAVGGTDDISVERAARVRKHMTWQLLYKMKNYKADKDALLIGVPLNGSAFTKTFRDDIKNMNVVRNVRAVDLVIPYGIGPRDIAEIERKTEICYLSPNKTQFFADRDFFTEAALPFSEGDNRETTKTVDEAHGLNEPISEKFKDAKIIEQHAMLDLGDGLFPHIITVDIQSRKLLRLVGRWEIDKDGNEVKKAWYDAREPVEYYTHYMFLPNPDGFYGLGMGHLIGQLNTSANKLLRQTIDAGTLSTVGNLSGFISSALGVGKGEIELILGKFETIAASGDDLQKGIWIPKFPGPSQVLPSTMEFLLEKGQRLSTVTEALTGQTEKVQQPTTILALIEQGLQVFSSVFERLSENWTEELRKLYRLNRLFLDETEYFSVLDDESPELLAVALDDYAADLQISPLADPKRTTERQKLTRAELEYNFAIQNPIIASNPEALRVASENFLKAIGSKNIKKLLPEPEPPPRIDDPNLENVAYMDPAQIPPDAFPDQDHDFHMEVHIALLDNKEFVENMPPERAELLVKHVQKHNALKFGVESGAVEDQQLAQA